MRIIPSTTLYNYLIRSEVLYFIMVCKITHEGMRQFGLTSIFITNLKEVIELAKLSQLKKKA